MNPSDQRDDRGLKKRTDKRKIGRERKKDKRGILMWEIWEEIMDDFLLQNYSDDLDLDAQNAPSRSETVEPPPNFILPLLRYQKEWLAWSLEKENSPLMKWEWGKRFKQSH